MFTGIVEAIGIVRMINKESGNYKLTIHSPFTQELKIDQSISHNGICLTVVSIHEHEYDVVAIEETISRTNLGNLKVGDKINLERSLKLGDRIDGHFVQGHVDETAVCKKIDAQDGSWLVTFEYKSSSPNILVEKGSVCVNGVSLTVVNETGNLFSVAVIPFTFEHTNFHSLKQGDFVNVEFDVIGKYITRLAAERRQTF